MTEPAKASPHNPRQVFDVAIERIGARGDGVATVNGQPIYIPFTLAGEKLRASVTGRRGEGLAGEALEITSPSAQRVVPPCRHFGVCGGCALQHMAMPAYGAWKVEQIRQALARRGIADVTLQPMLSVAPGERRRAVLTALRTKRGAIVGFNARATHVVIDLIECPVSAPPLVRAIATWRKFIADHLPVGAQLQVIVNQLDNGLDVLLKADRPLDLTLREALAALGQAEDLARISWQADGAVEPVMVARQPILQLGAVQVEPPPGAFLQASARGEAAMRQAVSDWSGAAKRVVDFYAGIGSLSLHLAPISLVHCVEGDREAVAALDKAGRQPAARRQISAEQRDLARNPVMPDELSSVDCAIFDPPRIGAAELARAMAQSSVPTIIAGSCDPATFARDAAILIEGGYRLVEVRPIDQFLWSPHSELIALFRRERL